MVLKTERSVRSEKTEKSGRSLRSIGLKKHSGGTPPLSPGGVSSPRAGSSARSSGGGASSPSSSRPPRIPTPQSSSNDSVAGSSVKTSDTDLSRRQKQLERAVLDVSDEFVCPLSKDLMCDPVLAEDGNLYERQELEKYIVAKAKGGSSLKSPVTGKPMGASIRSAATVKNTITKLVASGAISVEDSSRWKKKIMNEHMVETMKQRATEGSGNAMYNIGVWHQFGRFGFKQDYVQAFKWYMKSADKRDPCGMANAGCCLIWGLGTVPNQMFGMHLLTSAANSESESDFACKTLADMFDKGMLGMPRDDKKARYYYIKALEADAKYRQLTPEERENIAKKLRKAGGRRGGSPRHVKKPSIGDSVASWFGIAQCAGSSLPPQE